MGSAALWQLAKRGVSVLGIEQHAIAHARGSSHGETRIIRKAYFEHPDYVPLLNDAYELWDERESGEHLFERVGLLLAGRPESEVIRGVLRARDEHALAIDTLTRDALAKDYPCFTIDDDMTALYEADAGFLRVERCVSAHVEQAKRRGAEVLAETEVVKWRVERAGSVVVETRDELYCAQKLVVCAGAWSNQVIGELRLQLVVERRVQLWFATDDARLDAERGCPVFAFDGKEGFFCGFPRLDGKSVKVAQHSGVRAPTDPESVDRSLHERDVASVVRFTERRLKTVSARVEHHAACLYTMTPDEHFVIGTHATQKNVSYAAGFSGHGFKFASVVGKILADLALDGSTGEPIGFLSPERAALRSQTP